MIGLRLIDESHGGQNINDCVASVLANYGLSKKMFSITLDNASAMDNLNLYCLDTLMLVSCSTSALCLSHYQSYC